MNIKKITTIAVIILIFSIGAIIYIFQDTKVERIDTVAVNDITQSLAEQWDAIGRLDSLELPCLQYKLDYVVIDNNGHLVKATRRGLNENINSAIMNRDTIVDISMNNTILGKLIIYNDTLELWKQYRDNLLVYSIIIITFIAVFCIVYAVYIDRKIFRPFRKLQTFAKNVAEGKLDMPLEMDKGNMFGAFTESFDLMREELKKARESERIANQSKKELVASLSHDIKTPIASIKAISEVMQIKLRDANDKRQMEVINSKADQVNTLITNMFTATLEELQKLSVTVNEHPSTILKNLIKNADYNHKVTLTAIPECLILADMLRLEQVIDNIISNSYKYADTSIDVSAYINGQYIELEFRDYGPGVSPDEIPLLFNKFYRAKNSAGKSGSGLGLYISKYLINKMSGEIDCKNIGHGLVVLLKFRLA